MNKLKDLAARIIVYGSLLAWVLGQLGFGE